MFVSAKLYIIKKPTQLSLYLYKVKKLKTFQGETNVIQSMKSSESKQLAGYIFTCCLALAPSSPLLAVFAVQSLLAVSLCQLLSTEETSSWKYSCAWYHLRILRKKLGKRR